MSPPSLIDGHMLLLLLVSCCPFRKTLPEAADLGAVDVGALVVVGRSAVVERVAGQLRDGWGETIFQKLEGELEEGERRGAGFVRRRRTSLVAVRSGAETAPNLTAPTDVRLRRTNPAPRRSPSLSSPSSWWKIVSPHPSRS